MVQTKRGSERTKSFSDEVKGVGYVTVYETKLCVEFRLVKNDGGDGGGVTFGGNNE